MSCEWQVGLLVMRTCGAPSMSGCSFCGTPLCAAHTMSGGDGAPACPRCAASHQGYESNEDTELASARDLYYKPYGGAAAFGTQGYFNPAESQFLNNPVREPKRPRDEEEYDHLDT